ncbi:MAG: 4-alpha-glucanotransferase, partial [Treponema sp.]|nr:4-alpha-glucanotransferase [Treponema sp.]
MERKTGVVVPLSALYTKDCEAAGDFLALKDFADFCDQCSLSVIQLLPVNDTGTQSSPYSGLSAYALHPLYIRIEALPEFEEAYRMDSAFAKAYRAFKKDFKYTPRFNYDTLLNRKTELLHLLYNYIEKRCAGKIKAKAAPKSKKTGGAESAEAAQTAAPEKLTPPAEEYEAKLKGELDAFVRKNKWIVYYAVFKDLKDSAMQASWKSWSDELKNLDRKQIELRWNNKAHRSSHNFFVWCQLRAAQQFQEAADYVKGKGITLKGDLPILMNDDSADCWAWPEYFNQEQLAGSPPDGENPVGQNWGFPTYSWDRIAASGFEWWKERVLQAGQYYRAFRIDHILGFFRIWSVRRGETTAYLGHTVPYTTISRDALEQAGFDEGRVNWLSKPHIPTGLIEDITWNHEEAVAILSKLCNRVGEEELWNFKKEILTDGQIYSQPLADDEGKDRRLKEVLARKWRDRALIEIEDDSFIPVYSYPASTAWKSLNAEEQEKLRELFTENAKAEDKLREKQALETLTPICRSTDMMPCAEDLGASLACMPGVLDKVGIMSLKVVRWNREWGTDGQPYVPFGQYPEMSVCTTSVHDSPTLRQWWNNEKQSVE